MSATHLISTTDFLTHWQGLRRLTRKVILAFPDDKLFTFSIGGMRPFGELARELLAIAGPMVKELASSEPRTYTPPEVATKADLLRLWDEATEEINQLFPTIPAGRFSETSTVFGEYTGPGWGHFFYAVDNENHHRGQGYVYLRALGIEPPAFWDLT